MKTEKKKHNEEKVKKSRSRHRKMRKTRRRRKNLNAKIYSRYIQYTSIQTMYIYFHNEKKLV